MDCKTVSQLFLLIFWHTTGDLNNDLNKALREYAMKEMKKHERPGFHKLLNPSNGKEAPRTALFLLFLKLYLPRTNLSDLVCCFQLDEFSIFKRFPFFKFTFFLHAK